MRATSRLAGVLGLAACALLGCRDDAPDELEAAHRPRAPLQFVRMPEAFPFQPGPVRAVPFEILLADVDDDGDADLWVNWHVMAEHELWENRNGRFVPIHPSSVRLSGLETNTGVRSLFLTRARAKALLEREERPGIYVWHDEDRRGWWHVVLVGGGDLPADARLHLRANRPIVDVEGLSGPVDRPAAGQLTIPARTLRESRRISLRVERIATELRIALDPGGALPIRVGADFVTVEEPISLWKADPHGVALVDVTGSGLPELFVSRGGLQGDLVPPLPPKRNRLHLRSEPGAPFRPAGEDVLPGDYGRARRVEWVDVDGDGALDLYVGNRHTPNALWMFDEGGRLVDRAAAWQLDLMEGDRFAWLDVDEDGRQDVVVLADGRLRVGLGSADGVDWREGRELGLVLPGPVETGDVLFEEISFCVLDFDRDGELDLWVSGVGERREAHLFLGAGSGFAEATAQVGLAGLTGLLQPRPADLDGDGYVDVVAMTDEGVVALRNRRGLRIVVEPLDLPTASGPARAIGVAQVAGDGALDVVVLDARRHVFGNVTAGAGEGLHVIPVRDGPSPIGALVTAHYDDGTLLAQRFGSAASTADSQGLLPLFFGENGPAKVTSLSVRWPGTQWTESFEPQRSGGVQRLERGSGRSSPASAQAPRHRPNVIVVLVDTLRRDHLSLYGYEHATSPALDGLAGESIVFTRALSTSSWTKPSTTSLLTGLLPGEHSTEGENTRAAEGLVFLAEVLAERGYQTAAFSANPYVSPTYGLDQGFEVFELHGGSRPEDYVDARALITQARLWLDGRSDAPFFLYVHLMNVHGPYRAPEAYRERFLEQPSSDFPFWSPLWVEIAHRGRVERRSEVTEEHLRDLRARYDGAIAYTDDVLGFFVEDLRTRGVLDESVLVVTSDHGEELFDHGSFGHRQTLHPEQLEVPLLVRLPHGALGGRRIDRPASVIDVAATVLDAVGILPDLPGGAFGRGVSLLPAARGEDAPPESRLLMAELLRPRGRDWMAQQWPYRILAQGAPQEIALHRMDRDPAGQTDLRDEAPEVVADLVARAAALRAELERSAVPGSEIRPDDELRRRLEALGYLGDESR